MYELCAQACSLYFTTHTLRSGLQFLFHNSYFTLRLTVYISQLIHHANCKPERDVWVVKYKLQAWAWCMSCEIWTVSLSVMYELRNINCKPERDVWVVKYKLLAWAWCTTHTSRSALQFIFHNSYITLRLTVSISQLILYARLWNINCKAERDVWVVKYKLQAWAWCMSCEI
jgi:hypothetical protein